MKRQRGVAALTALGVAAVLAVLAVVCLSLIGWRSQARARFQRSMQATWNARAGREHYLATGRLTPELTLAPGELCRATRAADGTLTFEGLSQGVSRKLVCVAGDPSRITEEP